MSPVSMHPTPANLLTVSQGDLPGISWSVHLDPRTPGTLDCKIRSSKRRKFRADPDDDVDHSPHK
jgi:hypothetical protein